VVVQVGAVPAGLGVAEQVEGAGNIHDPQPCASAGPKCRVDRPGSVSPQSSVSRYGPVPPVGRIMGMPGPYRTKPMTIESSRVVAIMEHC
jgi:hypothetical protein